MRNNQWNTFLPLSFYIYEMNFVIINICNKIWKRIYFCLHFSPVKIVKSVMA